jgi:hypothetical protein
MLLFFRGIKKKNYDQIMINNPKTGFFIMGRGRD